MVLMSINRLPLAALAKIPSLPSATCSTSLDEGSIVTMMPHCRATSATLAPATAPAVASSSTAFWLMSSTTSSNPARRRFSAMDLPMRPKPIKPIFSMPVSCRRLSRRIVLRLMDQ
ncbi:hypothetical protein D3C72_1817150 [compost metagenome]